MVSRRVHAAAGELFPFTSGGGLERFGDVVREDGRATDFFHEQAAAGERLIADHLGGETMTRPTGEPEVFRIVGHDLGRGETALAVGLGEDDGFEESFYVPAGADEFTGEPVEELGVFGAVGLVAEVVDGFDQALAKERLPETIYRHAGEQRMTSIGEPTREAETVARLIGGEGREHGGRIGRDGGAAVVVLAALQDVGGLGRGQLAHDHDFFGGVGELSLGRAGGGECGDLGAVGRVVVGEIGFKPRVGGRLGVGGGRVKRADFNGGELAAEDAEVVDQPALEAAIAETFAEVDGVTAAASDVFGEMIADDFGADGLAVDEDAQAGGATGAVVGDGDVDPLMKRKWIDGADGDGIARPEVNQRPLRATVFEEEFVAAATGISPCAGAVEDDGAVGCFGRLQPERKRERLVAVEVADLGFDGVVAGEFERLARAGTTGNRDVGRCRHRVIGGSECVGEAGELDGLVLRRQRLGGGRFGFVGRGGLGWKRRGVALIEIETREFVAQDRASGGRLGEPSLEGVTASVAEGGEIGDSLRNRGGGGGEFLLLSGVA